MKKKVLAIAVAVVLALGCTTFLTACGKKKGTVDTFEGVISEKTYDSSENAVKGFLAEELSSEYMPATYVSHEKDSDVKLDKLTLTDAEKTNAESAEKIKVKFNKVHSYDGYEAASAPATPKVYENKVTVIKYSDGKYRFYVSLPDNGEVVTRSYIKSLFVAKSVTVKMTSEERTPNFSMGDEPGSTPTITVRVRKSTQEMKFGETATYQYSKSEKGTDYEESTSYVAFKDGAVWSMYKDKAKEGDEAEETEEGASKKTYWDETTDTSKDYASFADYLKDNSFSELASEFIGMDYQAFIKTDYGMTIDIDTSYAEEGMTIKKAAYKIEVKNGKLSKVTSENRYTLDGVNDEFYELYSITVSDVDSTNVEVPADFLALINKDAE